MAKVIARLSRAPSCSLDRGIRSVLARSRALELLTRRLPYEMRDGGVDRQLVEPSEEETARFGNVLTVLLRAASLQPESRYATAIAFAEAFQTDANSV